MEKCFVIAENTQFVKDVERYNKNREKQRLFVVDFFQKYNIKADKYIVGGTGIVNQSFSENQKNNISFGIIPSDEDLKSFKKQLKAPDKRYGLRRFKIKSKIMKLFTQGCIDEQIVINLYEPKPRDYFRSIGYEGYRYNYFEHNGKHFLMVDSDDLKDDDIPEGFTVIKTSEFYKSFEGIEE